MSNSLQRWYNDKVKIPNNFDGGLLSFAASGIGIVGSIVGGTKISIGIDRFASTAYADLATHHIFLPFMLFTEDNDAVVGRKITAEQAATLSLGLTAHEAAHFKHSMGLLGLPKEELIKPLLKALVNIVEDYYIESQIEEQHYNLFWTISEGLWPFFFPAVKRITDKGASIVDFMISRKNRTLPLPDNMSALEMTVLELMEDARKAHDINDRFEIAKEIMSLMDEEYVKKACEPQNELDGLIILLPVNCAGRSGSATPRLAGKEAFRAEMTERMIEISLSGGMDVCLEQEVIFDELAPPIRETTIEPDKRYEHLAKLSRETAVVNRPKGIARNSGTKFGRLNRIITDGKIFREPMELNHVGPGEFVILVDASGSMSSMDEKFESMFSRASKAAIGAAIGLTSAMHKCAIYAHTADLMTLEYKSHVRIFRIKQMDEPWKIGAARFAYMNTSHPVPDREFSLCQNRDGHAIRYMAKKFTSKRNTKTLIVISDGVPQAHGYGGRMAATHTRDAVNWLRQRGVRVFSISITDAAMKGNSYIYGDQYNVCNEDPNGIVELLERLLTVKGVTR